MVASLSLLAVSALSALLANASLGRGNPSSTGLDRHDMLYCGEWQTDRPGEHMYLIRGGKIVWSYEIGDKEEYGDCWMLSNGNILFSRKDRGATEIRPDLNSGKGGTVVWNYQGQKGGEVHTSQPVGPDKALIMQNGFPPKLMLWNRKKNLLERTWLPESGPGSVHGQFRHVRMTDKGTLLIAYLNKGKVVEYDQDWKVLWEYADAPSVWAAVRLKNGNTLISGNQHKYVREITPDKKVVWELTQADVDFPLFVLQEATRLNNGNTLINNWVSTSSLPRDKWSGTVQIFEVTPDKKVVWKLSSWSNPNLGPASATHVLSDPGVPEKLGDLQR